MLRRNNIFIFADKTRNIYETSLNTYNELLHDNITKTYKHGSEDLTELKEISNRLGIGDRIERMKKREAFISLKDHKENFENNPKCRLVNPAKSESGKLSKVILHKINSRNTQQVISRFGNINNKDRHSFISFDIVDFYPSISEKLLNEALAWASDLATNHRKRYFNNKTCKKISTFRQRQIMDKKRRKQQFI